MAQSPPGFRRMPPPPPRWSFRPWVPPPPPYSHDKPASQPHGRIIAGVFIGIVASLLVFIIVCSLCRGHRNSRARAAARARSPPERSAVAATVRVDQRQLRQACAASGTAGLLAFTYSRSVKQNVTGGAEETATCSVCLAALRLGETVRLLPACLHLYHAECIDPWLDAHSTCPICRSDTDPATGVARLPPV